MFKARVINRRPLFAIAVTRLAITAPNYSASVLRWDSGSATFDAARPPRSFDGRSFTFDDPDLTFDAA
ncbi:hypothetical protein [Profundibacterium mesophilum]|uniref:Uncharacterized protein n=1 Tax=Profundibacterium mesophilum KAUST100406-0324 TaxID=1037889 RepID=A0A921NWG1_9RHOB|nr:hypothetical protein [Profundibacterium mesophilum]KAF0676720.1 hypothetical protein PMES_00907 [Profundibacterium mesophilum KAUST100406-0324]